MAKKNIATFLGPNKGISVVGNHAYAYCVSFAAATSSATVLSFQSPGQRYIVGKFTLNSAIQVDTANITGTFFRIKFNGEQVAIAFSGNGANDSPSSAQIDIILPPNTAVLVEAWADGSAGSSLANVQFTGRVYDV